MWKRLFSFGQNFSHALSKKQYGQSFYTDFRNINHIIQTTKGIFWMWICFSELADCIPLINPMHLTLKIVVQVAIGNNLKRNYRKIQKIFCKLHSEHFQRWNVSTIKQSLQSAYIFSFKKYSQKRYMLKKAHRLTFFHIWGRWNLPLVDSIKNKYFFYKANIFTR